MQLTVKILTNIAHNSKSIDHAFWDGIRQVTIFWEN